MGYNLRGSSKIGIDVFELVAHTTLVILIVIALTKFICIYIGILAYCTKEAD